MCVRSCLDWIVCTSSCALFTTNPPHTMAALSLTVGLCWQETRGGFVDDCTFSWFINDNKTALRFAMCDSRLRSDVLCVMQTNRHKMIGLWKDSTPGEGVICLTRASETGTNRYRILHWIVDNGRISLDTTWDTVWHNKQVFNKWRHLTLWLSVDGENPAILNFDLKPFEISIIVVH